MWKTTTLVVALLVSGHALAHGQRVPRLEGVLGKDPWEVEKLGLRIQYQFPIGRGFGKWIFSDNKGCWGFLYGTVFKPGEPDRVYGYEVMGYCR